MDKLRNDGNYWDIAMARIILRYWPESYCKDRVPLIKGLLTKTAVGRLPSLDGVSFPSKR
jgi:hypothetical protein